MKLFSLIDKEEVEIDLQKKILSAKQFSELLDIEELLKKAKQEVEEFKENAKREMAEAHEKKEKEGFLEGQKKWSEQIANLQKKLIDLRQEFEKEMIPLILQCGKKILGKELSIDPTLVVGIVKNALKPISSHKFVTIFVNKEDEKILEENKPKLKEVLELAESIKIDSRPNIARAGCIIETESGIINATIDTLWESLETALTTLIKRS